LARGVEESTQATVVYRHGIGVHDTSKL
jgi:hypothetical protein